MKDYIKTLTVVLSALILAGAILYLASSLQKLPKSCDLKGSLSISDNKQYNDKEFLKESDFLSQYEVASYLGLSDENVNNLIKSGQLKGTYLYIDGEYIFSNKILTEHINQLIEQQ